MLIIRRFLIGSIVSMLCGCGGGSDAKPDASNTGTPAVSVCSSASALSTNSKGDTWYVFGTPGACATPSCTITPERVCERLQAPKEAWAGVGVGFQTHLDLSGKTGMAFTADVRPVGASFDAAIASANGAHGTTWVLTAQSGATTYQVAFDRSTAWSNDAVAFDLHDTESFAMGDHYQTGGDLTVTLTDVQSW